MSVESWVGDRSLGRWFAFICLTRICVEGFGLMGSEGPEA